MRKILSIGLATALVFTLTACKPQKTVTVRWEESEPVNSMIKHYGPHPGAESEIPSSSLPSSENVPTVESEQKPIIHTGNFEKPSAANAATAFGGMSGLFDNEAEILRKTIVNAKNIKSKSKSTYYISYRGDNSNSGMSADAPMKDFYMVQPLIRSGDTVLFERNGIYRTAIVVQSGVTYGAYGTGYKPCIYGSIQNYAVVKIWTKDGGNIWKTVLPDDQTECGAIFFDNGKAVADYRGARSALTEDYTFYYNAATKTVYLYCSKGNPGKVFKEIEISGFKSLIDGNRTGLKDITVENLCLRYCAQLAVSFSNGARNITVQNCEIGFAGGGFNDGTRYGNGIQFWESCSDITVDHCWVYHCFDAGITHQFNGTKSHPAMMNNVVFSNNLVEYCEYALEYFNYNGTTKNCSYRDNILRFAGYGLFPSTERKNSGVSPDASSLLCCWNQPNDCVNFMVKNNIFDTADKFLLVGYDLTDGQHSPLLSGNSYGLQKTKYRLQTATPLIWAQNGEYNNASGFLKATNQTEMSQNIKIIDSLAKRILFQP